MYSSAIKLFSGDPFNAIAIILLLAFMYIVVKEINE